MKKVLIDEDVFDAICIHYDALDPSQMTAEDERVLYYLKDKLNRQIDRLLYTARKD